MLQVSIRLEQPGHTGGGWASSLGAFEQSLSFNSNSNLAAGLTGDVSRHQQPVVWIAARCNCAVHVLRARAAGAAAGAAGAAAGGPEAAGASRRRGGSTAWTLEWLGSWQPSCLNPGSNPNAGGLNPGMPSHAVNPGVNPNRPHGAVETAHVVWNPVLPELAVTTDDGAVHLVSTSPCSAASAQLLARPLQLPGAGVLPPLWRRRELERREREAAETEAAAEGAEDGGSRRRGRGGGATTEGRGRRAGRGAQSHAGANAGCAGLAAAYGERRAISRRGFCAVFVKGLCLCCLGRWFVSCQWLCPG